MRISAVIPVYKNKQLFITNLIHNYSFLKNIEIIVVDDASGENLTSTLKKKFKKIKTLTNDLNLGFAKSVNRGINHTKGDLVLLLNSDVRIEKIDFSYLINQLQKNPSFFAISFLQKEKDGRNVGKNRIFLKRGLILHDRAKNNDYGITAWAEGGACIMQKKIFEEIGGFDQIYAPFYWEDIDLSYRAYKAGYKVIFDPNIVVEHHHESTIARYFKKNYIQRIAFRNQFIFIWKNITDKKIFFSHLISLPFHLITSSLRFNQNLIVGFISAVTKLPRIIFEKKGDKIVKVSDQTIFSLFNKI